MGEDEEDDDVRSISGKEDDAEPEMDDEEALSGDDDLTGLQPAEVVKRLAQEVCAIISSFQISNQYDHRDQQVIWPGDVPDAEDRRQPVPSKIDKAGTIVVQEFEDEPPQMTGQGGIRLQRAIAEVWASPTKRKKLTSSFRYPYGHQFNPKQLKLQDLRTSNLLLQSRLPSPSILEQIWCLNVEPVT